MEAYIVCKKPICSTFHMNKQDQYYCIKCLKRIKMDCNDKQPAKSNYKILIEKIKLKLNDASIELDAIILSSEIEEIYEIYISKHSLDTITNGINSISYTVLGANYITILLENNIDSNNEFFHKIICEIDFSEGGNFISNKTYILN